ncbi:enoyl-CoA hydratase/isomerase family protein [Sphingomonas sp. ID0503]|uniref:enoyl-CoA hydratase/isomerase family protein n=1 Tax=Sphingomonas sp. ID0503 TaxID=3399691 RepID=UPI003AFB0709
MTFAKLSLSVENGLARLTLTDAARGNPIDDILCGELSEAAIRLSEDAEVRCVLLTAEGKAFSYGGDIAAFTSDLDDLPRNIKRWTTTLHSAIARLQRMDAPIVTAVQGVCAGGMSGFVAGSDIVVAGEDARFVAAYAGIGFNCDAGSSIMYTRRMGAGRTRRFLLLNETLSAEEALAVGLADKVVPSADLIAEATAIATRLANGPTKAFGEMRRLLLSVHDQPLETQLELEAQALARSAGTEDAREALTAFAQKRKPTFRGA